MARTRVASTPCAAGRRVRSGPRGHTATPSPTCKCCSACAGFGCFKKNGRQYAQCRPMGQGSCVDDSSWLCPDSWIPTPPPAPSPSPASPLPPPSPSPPPWHDPFFDTQDLPPPSPPATVSQPQVQASSVDESSISTIDAGGATAPGDTADELRARLARQRKKSQQLASELAFFQTTTALLLVALTVVALWMRFGSRLGLQRLSACAMPAGDDESGEAPGRVPWWEFWRRPAWSEALDEAAERVEDGDEATASAHKQRGAAPPPSVRAAQWLDEEQQLSMCVRPNPPGACKIDG